MKRMLLLAMAVALVLAMTGAISASDCSCCWFHKLHREACPPYRLMPSPTTQTYTKPPCTPGAPCCQPYQGPQPWPKFYFPMPEQVWAKKLHPTCVK